MEDDIEIDLFDFVNQMDGIELDIMELDLFDTNYNIILEQYDDNNNFIFDWRILDNNENNQNFHNDRVDENIVKFNNPSIMKIIQKSGIFSELSDDGIKYISDIVYMRCSDILKKSLIVLDERDSKILSHIDIINSLKMENENNIFPDKN
jgi:hypothetical protein